MSALPPCSEPARIARLCWLLLFVLAASMPSPALAHKASDSYLFVETGDDGAGTLRWDIALRVAPGSRQFTRVPCPASSSARARQSPSRPDFVA